VKKSKKSRKSELDELDYAITCIRVKMLDECLTREIARSHQKRVYEV